MIKVRENENLKVIHQRLLKGDRIASEELILILLHRLSRELVEKFPRTDKHWIYDGVTDALLDYCNRPSTFDQNRGTSLERFLANAAWRNIANIIRGERRRKIREGRFMQNVELYESPGNIIQEQQKLKLLMAKLDDPIDRKIFEMRMNGERRTGEFAKILGVSHLPIIDQRKVVKRAKDRINKILQRSIHIRK
jgi:RNA polymerase sigma-70 factor (ECF subfamily)